MKRSDNELFQDILLRIHNDDYVSPWEWIFAALQCIRRSSLFIAYVSLETVVKTLGLIVDWEREKSGKRFQEAVEEFRNVTRCPHRDDEI